MKRIRRLLTPEERARVAQVRQQVEVEFPPKLVDGGTTPPPGIPAKIRAAREAKGLTWHALAELAGLPDSKVVRDMETGLDVSYSAVEAVANVLGLRLELVQSA